MLRIRIRSSSLVGSSADPDPQHWLKNRLLIAIDEHAFFQEIRNPQQFQLFIKIGCMFFWGNIMRSYNILLLNRLKLNKNDDCKWIKITLLILTICQLITQSFERRITIFGLTTHSLRNLHQSRQNDVPYQVTGLVRSYVAAPPARLACLATNRNLVRDGTVCVLYWLTRWTFRLMWLVSNK